jgi:4-carboxymuconolactone decarboxylase
MKFNYLVAMALCLPAVVVHGQTTKGNDPIHIWKSEPTRAKEAPAEYFTGTVRVDTIPAPSSHLSSALVTFEPGARTAWHTHPFGQMLIVTAGEGRVQAWGEPIHVMRQGDVVWIPGGEKHWHGAAPSVAMAHIAIAKQKGGNAVTWLEKVEDAQYNAPLQQAPAVSGPAKAKPSAKAIGDFDPKLAELTDDVLYGDVWERPELSKRDRSMITVAALIAMNRPDQLRSHLKLARENGVTQQEIVESITQLAFYAGWPNAVSAIAVAKEVYGAK